MSGSYYNEFDPYAAEWLRNLIAAGHLPAGDVDERSIVDVAPSDLAGYRQCHFFAGIGGWALAARLAGWSDDLELWTGSPPCQPFSVAGQGKAQADDRHLWPHLFRLASARRPAVLMGEQVAAAVGKNWLDGVFADLEGIGYACGAAVVPACAVDAPHRRDRLWFVAHTDHAGSQGFAGDVIRAAEGRGEPLGPAAEAGLLDRAEHAGGAVGDAVSAVRQRGAGCLPSPETRVGGADGAVDGHLPVGLEYAGQGSRGSVSDANIAGSCEERQQRSGQLGGAGGDPGACVGAVPDPSRFGEREQDDENPAVAAGWSARAVPFERGHWDGAGWIIGHDGKARRVGARLRQLADGLPAGMAGLRAGRDAEDAEEVEMIPLLERGVLARVGKLRAFGNAIVPQVAAEVIGAYLDCRP